MTPSFRGLFILTTVLFIPSCFLIPKIQIYRALKKYNCEKIFSLQDYLNKKEVLGGFQVCFSKKNYKRALDLLDLLESLSKELSEKYLVFEKKGLLFFKMKQHLRSSVYLKKALKIQPEAHGIRLNLVKTLISTLRFEEGLKEISFLLKNQLQEPLKSEAQLEQGKLLFFLGKNKEALKVLKKLKQKNPSFFSSQKGQFYLALVLEKEGSFQEAIKEMDQTQWPFSQYKKRHWEYRNRQAPKGLQ